MLKEQYPEIKMKYSIIEAQNIYSSRGMVEINAVSLTAAKRAATKTQMFQGTVLRLFDDKGWLLAYKESGKWHNA